MLKSYILFHIFHGEVRIFFGEIPHVCPMISRCSLARRIYIPLPEAEGANRWQWPKKGVVMFVMFLDESPIISQDFCVSENGVHHPNAHVFTIFLIGKIWEKYGKICENMENIWEHNGEICEHMENIWEKYGKPWISGAPHLGGRKQLFEINLREADLFVPSDGDPSGFFGVPVGWQQIHSTH